MKGNKYSENAKLIKFSQKHFAKANEIVLSHTIEIRDAIPFATFNDYLDKRKEILEFTINLDLALIVIDSEDAFATAFPSGIIAISESLINSLYVENDKINNVLLGILIHELTHVRDGHAIEQWATSDGRNKWVSDKTLGAVATLTAIIPFFTVNYDIKYGVAFKSFSELPELSEYAADLATVSLLEKNGFEKESYIKFLNQVNNIINKSGLEASEPFSWLNGRVECLRDFSSFKFDKLLGVVIGSREDGDNIIRTINVENLKKLYNELDNPVVLRENYRGTKPLSDAQIRELILREIEKNMFTVCAIRNSFPNAQLKDGVLHTTGFDLSMFQVHH